VEAVMAEQMGFASVFLGSGIGRNRRLDAIDGLIDWNDISAIGRLARPGEWGRPPYPPLAMIKALLLQQWYGLSDPGLEEALSDRVSFRRFCGLALDGGTPDETTLCRFRQTLTAKGLAEPIFAAVLAQLDARGLVLRAGTIMDATVIAASVKPPRYKDKSGQIQGPTPSPTDPQASWTRGGAARRSMFGYKAHIATDQGSGLIRKAIMTTAKTYESEVADELLCGDERAVYADKAYEKKTRREALKAAGIKDRILHRRHKHIGKLPHWQHVRNKLISPIRTQIERTFGVFKRHYGWRQVRYIGIQANQTHLHLIAAAFNLRRAVALLA
jgi:transposase, IS5 family